MMRRSSGFLSLSLKEWGSFQDIAKGDTVEGRGWPVIHGHTHYAKIYRVISVRHTLSVSPSGAVTHLKSLFVEPVVPPSSSEKPTHRK